MKKIFLIFIIFIIFPNITFSQETVWDVKDESFWTEIQDDSLDFEKKKQQKLDACIELDLNAQSYEIDLIDAINHGIENSSSYKISKYQKQYSDWEFRNKLSEFLPDISYSFSLADLKGEFLVGGILPRYVHETVYSSTFTTQMEVFNARKIFESIQLRNQQKAKKHTQNYTREDLIYRVSVAYYELLQKKTETEIYRYNLLEAEEQYKYNQALYDIGKGTRFDILRAESVVEEANADLENSIFSLKTAQTNLANIAGYPIFANLLPKDKIVHKLELVAKDKTPDILFAQAIIAREDIKAKENSIKALRAKRNSTVGDFMPSVILGWESAVVGTFSSGSRKNDTYSVLVTVPLGKNLGINTLTKYKMDDMNIKIAKTELEKMISEIQKNITDNFYGVKSGDEIIKAKNRQIITTKEGLRQAIARMKIGEATYLDVIEANKQKTQARIDLINSIINYNKIQLKQLLEIGNMNQMEIKTKYEEAKKLFK